MSLSYKKICSGEEYKFISHCQAMPKIFFFLRHNSCSHISLVIKRNPLSNPYKILKGSNAMKRISNGKL